MSLRAALCVAACVAVSGPALADGFADAMAALRAGDTGTGAALFAGLAAAGDGDAMYNLSLLYLQGIGVPQNREEAVYWAWRARLVAVPRAPALIALASEGLSRESLAALHLRLMAEERAVADTTAPASFVRLALVEQGLAAKPDQVQVYTWYSLAAAMGHPGAEGARDAAFARLKPKEALTAEAHAMAAFGVWCAAVGADSPRVCTVLAARSAPEEQAESEG